MGPYVSSGGKYLQNFYTNTIKDKLFFLSLVAVKVGFIDRKQKKKRTCW